jgi:oligopeptide transport system substrate-binding protein
VLTLGVAACSSSKSDTATTDTSAASSEVPEGGTLIDGAQLVDPTSLTSYDPGQVQTLDESQVTTAIYDGLTEFDYTDPTNPELKGQVAESWEPNADASEFTFTIKPGQVFSNGDPVLPSSFRYAWNRNGLAEFASSYGYLIDYVKGGAALQDGTSTDLGDAVVADDTAMTLKVTLETPQADFPSIVSHPFFGPLPEKVVSQLADQTEWNKMIMIGNGPFKMEAPANEQEVVLVRNDSWAGDVLGNTRAKLDKIIFKISADQSSAYTDFEAGNLDTATIPSGQYADAMAKYGNTVDSPQLASYYFQFGWTIPELAGEKNVKLRQAMSLAIDREEINQKVYEGVRPTATGIAPPGVPGYKEGLCEYCSYDLDQAKSLLEEWKAAGNTLTPVTIDFNSGQGHEDVVAIVQENLKALGIETTTNPISSQYFKTMADGGCHFCRTGWVGDYPTYGNFSFDLFSTASVGGNNTGSFSDPAYDAILAQAQAEVDDTKRGELYQQAELYLLNTVTAAVPINTYVGDQVYADNVLGYVQPPLSIIQWQIVGVKQ